MDIDPKYFHWIRDEFQSFIQAPETQKKKRTYVRERIRALRQARDDRAAT